jgi:putative ATPase
VRIGATTITAVRADLTAMPIDAIVNAANEHLAHGGGLAAAVVRAGGRIVQEESDRWIAEHGPLSPGVAAVTTAGAMPADVVVHVAGPRFRAGRDNESLLRTAVDAALDAAVAAGCRSVAIPAISAGIFGYPLADATRVIASETVGWVRDHLDTLDDVRLVGYDDEVAAAFTSGLAAA